MEIKELNTYIIKFYTKEEFEGKPFNIFNWSGGLSMLEQIDRIASTFIGKKIDIPEELTKKIVDSTRENKHKKMNWEEIKFNLLSDKLILYKNYKNNKFTIKTSYHSFQTLSKLPYCIIIEKGLSNKKIY